MISPPIWSSYVKATPQPGCWQEEPLASGSGVIHLVREVILLMLSQSQKVSLATDGRYATDEELAFIDRYTQSFYLRVQTYQRLQVGEAIIVQQVQAKIQSIDPTLLHSGNVDVTGKWKRDTIRVLRYSAIAMLLDDSDTLRERFLFWFRTIMKAFGAERSCNMTYAIMQEVIKQYLSPTQANLFCPILEINRQILGNV